MFFVGSYRDNEVKPTHILFGFCDQLSSFEVPLTTIHLDGMPEKEMNLMISGALGMFPRLCRSLSQVVFRKTGGNPFFVQTFLRSLVDKGLLKYNLRGRSWVWDDTKINSENITPNVLDLVSAKMTTLSTNVQVRALSLLLTFDIMSSLSFYLLSLQRVPYYCKNFPV
jgi:predicted ATPase